MVTRVTVTINIYWWPLLWQNNSSVSRTETCPTLYGDIKILSYSFTVATWELCNELPEYSGSSPTERNHTTMLTCCCMRMRTASFVSNSCRPATQRHACTYTVHTKDLIPAALTNFTPAAHLHKIYTCRRDKCSHLKYRWLILPRLYRPYIQEYTH